MLDGMNTKIERMAHECGSYIDAVVDFAEQNEMDVEELADFLHPNIRDALKAEFIKKNHFRDKKIDNSLDGFLKEE